MDTRSETLQAPLISPGRVGGSGTPPPAPALDEARAEPDALLVELVS